MSSGVVLSRILRIRLLDAVRSSPGQHTTYPAGGVPSCKIENGDIVLVDGPVEALSLCPERKDSRQSQWIHRANQSSPAVVGMSATVRASAASHRNLRDGR